jgi:WS/DGAT/MGAT family acyltransferase
MASYKYDPLSAQDNSFLLMETPNLHMHVSSTQIFDAGPLRNAQGGIDVSAISRFTESVLHRIPRYRQKLRWIPFENTPVWVDDAHFRIDYHIRHTALPRPGNEDQLKRVAARIQAQQLDRKRPLWEIWVVEGLEGDRFALISKIHHCMIDGASGVDISQILQSPSPDATIHDAPAYLPKPSPSPAELFTGSWSKRLGTPLRALRGLRQFRDETENLGKELQVRVKAIRDMYAAQGSASSETPINGALGPHRSADWIRTPLEDLKAMRRGFGCTINDVVLTILTGAFRDYMTHRRVQPEELDFRAQTPVSMRSDDERGQLGNRISSWLVPLPLHESDPKRQLAQIHETTQELKESRQALGVEMMMQAMSIMPTALLSLGVQAASGAMNTIVTNVPGPQFPLYLLGAEMVEIYPMVPLLQNVGLGVALMSYNGNVCWGFNADRELVPDLGTFSAMVENSIDRVAAAAGAKRLAPVGA